MLEKYYDLTGVRLRGANEIDLYPKASDRKAWESIPETVKNQILILKICIDKKFKE